MPAATFPATGPVDVVRDGVTDALNTDLRLATPAALDLDGDACREYAISHSWQWATDQFATHLIDNKHHDNNATTPIASSSALKGTKQGGWVEIAIFSGYILNVPDKAAAVFMTFFDRGFLSHQNKKYPCKIF